MNKGASRSEILSTDAQSPERFARATYSIVIPVYNSAPFIADLVRELRYLGDSLLHRSNTVLEVVFVVDGSPDDSHRLLRESLSTAELKSKLVLLSRNFGSFAAVRTGLGLAEGHYQAIYSADMQEPLELLVDFLEPLESGVADIVIGTRSARADPWHQKLMSSTFWRLFRWAVIPETPRGGVDAFACTRQVSAELLKLNEANTSLIAQLLWLGFTRTEATYERRRRRHGAGSWTLRKKIKYMWDSFFPFSDLPIRLLWWTALVGVMFTIALAASLLFGEAANSSVELLMTLILSFNLVGLAILATYVWRAYENSKGRPISVVKAIEIFPSPQPQQANETAAAPALTLPAEMKIDHVPYTEETLYLSAEWLRAADMQALTDTPAFSLEDQLRWFAGLKAGGDYKTWTVRAEERPIGAFGIKHITLGQGEYWGYIGEREWWGKGVGNYLMSASAAEAKALNIPALVLRVNNKNIRAIKLYISNGYRIYQLEGDTHYLMRLDLST